MATSVPWTILGYSHSFKKARKCLSYSISLLEIIARALRPITESLGSFPFLFNPLIREA